MKKILLVAAAAGLMSVAACSSRTPEGAAVENNAEMLADNLEMQADNMDDLADNTSNDMAAASLENASDNLSAAADNVRDAGAARADRVDNVVAPR